MDADLLKAILAMDAYNHGYNAGILGLGNQIGTATLTTERGQADAEAIGFYAIAYTLG